VGFYILPALFHHDSGQYEAICYSNSKESDNFTERLKSYADGWRDVVDLKDEELHDLIIEDKIDILVDLSGHTGGNRLFIFARKPAPVQATWIGYFFTTGLSEIDYILMDDTAVLPGEEKYFSEKVIRLEKTRFCYEPPKNAPEVAELPALKNGFITFGCFNNLAKVTPAVLQLWGAVLNAVPGSRLFLKSHALVSDNVKERISTQFGKQGVSPDRLIFRGASPHVDMLAEYGDMDIALDPFPFNGGLTSCEALWMGVPVITLFGKRPIARQTSGFLKTIDLDGFIAQNEKEYVELAVRWSSSTEELSEIRSSLRKKMSDSLLCDGKRFATNLENTYREMWRQWCLIENPSQN
jgi:predicted O-linked N-acetylglucosamine transferase (SPINDLY family)